MRIFRYVSLMLMLASSVRAFGAERITVTKTIHASTGPWIVTLSINDSYPYGAWQSAPIAFSSDDGFGIRAGDVLTIQYVAGLWCAGTTVSVGTCVDADGYRKYDPVNDRAYNTSLYAPSKYIDPKTYPVLLMQLVGTFADARGQIVGVPFKVGNGPVEVTVPAGAVRLQLGSNMWSYVDARDYYTPLSVSVSGPPPPVMNPLGAMSQLAIGGGWQTTFVLVNSGSAPVQTQLSFFDDGGLPLPLPLTFSDSPAVEAALFSVAERTLGAGASLVIESAGADTQATQQGWAQLVADGDVMAFALYRQTLAGRTQEVAVPLETRAAGTYSIWFDHTGGLQSGLAVANLSAQATIVDVTIRDAAGAAIGADAIPLPAHGHAAFMAARWPETAQRRGTIDFRTAQKGQITMLGLRANGAAITAMPVIAK